ncbi:MAG: hypothetical protein FWF40_04340, partial [Methanomassiliicoccaceae archaeon]|nr:hypothetical protein [Methanomassiliicoccaceae archaeon]
AISMILVSSFAFAVFGAFGADDGYGGEGTLGASSTLAITDTTDLSVIMDTIAALNDGDVLTVTGSMDRGTEGSSNLYLDIPEGAKVIWNAYFRDHGGIGVDGGGSFEAATNNLDVGGVWTEGGTPTATLNGSIDFWGSGWGSGTYSTGSTMIINGNLTISGSNHGFRAEGGEVIINGNLVVTGVSSCVEVQNGGVMTINGSLTVLNDNEFVKIDSVWFAKGDHEAVSSKAGYREYTDGTSSVFVKIPSGGSNILLLVAIAAAITAAVGIAGYFLFLRKK